MPPAEADVDVASVDLDGEFRLQGLHFTLRLPTDPTTHLVVGQKEDTVGDVIQRISSGPWTEAGFVH
jgi:hypothetical protein